MVSVQKWPFFDVFFVRQYRPGKWLLRYSTTKERFFKLQTRRLKSRKVDGFGPKMAIFPTFF